MLNTRGTQDSTRAVCLPYRDHCGKCGARRVDRQIGLELTIDEFVVTMVGVFREVRRVLHPTGVCFINIGDSYASGKTDAAPRADYGFAPKQATNPHADCRLRNGPPPGLKPKDLCGIPWMLAKALQAPYYSGNIPSSEARSWLACAIESEGCIHMHRHKAGAPTGRNHTPRLADSFGPSLKVINTNEAFVRRCAEIAGVGKVRYYSKPGHRPFFEWGTWSNEARSVLREVYPHMISKRQEARIAISTPSCGPMAEAAWMALKLLHKGSDTDVDFNEPKSMYEAGYYLRSEIIWNKCNPMPESVTDRPTKSHEQVFLLSKSEHYYWDAEAVREPHVIGDGGRQRAALAGTFDYAEADFKVQHVGNGHDGLEKSSYNPGGRNLRSVWTIPTESYIGAHYATFPRKLVEPCILAGSSARGVCPRCGAPWTRVVEPTEEYGRALTERKAKGRRRSDDLQTRGLTVGTCNPSVSRSVNTLAWQPTCSCGTERPIPPDELDEDPSLLDDFEIEPFDPVPAIILDPFVGSGTVPIVAQALGRRAIGLDLSGEYLGMARQRIDHPHARVGRPGRQEYHPLFDGDDSC